MGGFDMHKVLATCFGVAAAMAAGGASANDESDIGNGTFIVRGHQRSDADVNEIAGRDLVHR